MFINKSKVKHQKITSQKYINIPKYKIMTYKDLSDAIKSKNSFLCVGLDSDIEKIPQFLLKEEDPVFEFNKRIINATHQYTIAYKINTAFYESRGITGWHGLVKTIDFINQNYPEIFVIADAKRGDIGNTSEQYAKAFFETLNCDAITIAPYMGVDSVSPFLSFKDKWSIVLGLTSNKGAQDFQFNYMSDKQQYIYENVISTSKEWGSKENMMYVVGATQTEYLQRIRKIIPDHFLLVPGVGVQGGSLEDVIKYGMNCNGGLLINSSRGIIYAGDGENFIDSVKEKAFETSTKMKGLLERYSK